MPDGASGYPAELAKRQFRLPWRFERRRTVLPELSIVAIGLIVLLLGALLAAIHRSEVDDERQALIKSTLWAEQHLHFQFASIEGKLAQLAALLGHEGHPTEMFQVQVRHLVRTEAEIERVLWLGAGGGIALETPPAEDAGGLPQASHNAFVMARSAGQRAYSAPLTTRGGAAGFEIQVPVFDAAGFAGTLVAQLSLRALLEEHLPWWFAERYRLEITDPLGVVLASKSRVPADDGGRSYAIALEPPGHGLMLVTTVYRAETHLTRNFLVAAILALAFATAWSLWSARRQIGRRLRAERALRAEYAFRKAMEDSLTVGMRARDLSGRITYVNPAFCRMVGWSAAELIGRAPPMPYWVPEDMERTLILHDAVLSRKAPSQGFEIRFRRRNGDGSTR
jgi:two-component system, LuxR family, sensor histidine kinase DctS